MPTGNRQTTAPRQIKEIDRQIKEIRGAATALTLEEKLAGQKQIKALEAQRNQQRRSLFDAQDQVDRRREELIAVNEAVGQSRRADRASDGRDGGDVWRLAGN